MSGCSSRMTVPASIYILNASGVDGDGAIFWFDEYKVSLGVFPSGQLAGLSGILFPKYFLEVRCKIIDANTKEERWHIFSGSITVSAREDLVVVVIPDGGILVEVHPDNTPKTRVRIEELRKEYMAK